MIASLSQLLAVVLPGAYRVLAIFMVGYFSSPEISNEYSKMFFWVGLLATLSGVSVASLSYSKMDALSLQHKFGLICILLFVTSLCSIPFWHGSYLSFGIIICSALFLSLFEVYRADYAASGSFTILSLSGIASTALLLFVVILLNTSANQLIAGSFLCILLPLVFPVIKHSFINKTKKILGFMSGLKKSCIYSVSNGFSTCLNFIVPLLLIREFGDDSGENIAQVFSISSMFFFYPRYLSAGFLVKAKTNTISAKNINDFFMRVLVFCTTLVCIFFVIVYLHFDDLLKLLSLFLAMQLAQLSLPYSCLFVALGRPDVTLRINAISAVVFLLATVCCFLFIDTGHIRGQLISMSFVLLMISRVLLNKRSAQKLIAY